MFVDRQAWQNSMDPEEQSEKGLHCLPFRLLVLDALLYIKITFFKFEDNYHNDPKFSDRYAWANSADPDQTAPRGAV